MIAFASQFLEHYPRKDTGAQHGAEDEMVYVASKLVLRSHAYTCR